MIHNVFYCQLLIATFHFGIVMPFWTIIIPAPPVPVTKLSLVGRFLFLSNVKSHCKLKFEDLH